MAKTDSKNKNQYWKALQYTKLKTNYTISAFKSLNNKIAVIMQYKKTWVKTHIFFKPPIFQNNKYLPIQKSAHLLVIQDVIARNLLCQSIKKTPGPNIYNFRKLRLI